MRSHVLDRIVARIESAQATATEPTMFVAIDGRGGSGKSTLADTLRQRLAKAQVVHVDDFSDRKLLLDSVIQPLRLGRQGRFQKYDWNRLEVGDWISVEPGGVVIIEGVYALHPQFADHYDVKVWVECPAQLGFARGLARDRSQYGVDTHDKWVNIWLPAEQLYVETHQPQSRADFIIDVEDLPPTHSGPRVRVFIQNEAGSDQKNYHDEKSFEWSAQRPSHERTRSRTGSSSARPARTAAMWTASC